MMIRRSASLILLLVVALVAAHANDKKTAKPATSDKSFTGTVSDAMCGKKHMMPDKSAADCTKECAKDGDYALVVGDKVYTLKGHRAEMEKLAGANATVTGTLKGDTIDVSTVSAAKTTAGKGTIAKPAAKKS